MKLFTDKVPSFKERLGNIKNMFQQAHNQAGILDKEMQDCIDKKKSSILALELEIGDIEETQNNNRKFMSNLEQFL